MRQLLTLTFFCSYYIATPALSSEENEPTCVITTPIFGQPPKDVNADPFLEGKWFVNPNRTIWAGWDASNLKVGRNKVLWIKPNGKEITIEANYISDQSEVVFNLANGYTTTFQPSLIEFTKPGCIKVTAVSNGNTLEFITKVIK